MRRPLLAWSARLAVLGWLAAFLAWPAAEAPRSEALLEAARIAARPELPPAPEPEPATAKPPEPARETPARPASVGASEIAAGEKLLFGDGRFPVLSSSYEDYPSFAAYAEAMSALGARFVVVERRRIVGAVDPATGAVSEGPVVGSFSPRARDYSGERGLAPLARAARLRFGSDAVVMMLVPRAVDAGLFGGIARELAARGEQPEGYSELHARYRRGPGGAVRIELLGGTRRDGSEAPLDLVFDLSAIARSGA